MNNALDINDDFGSRNIKRPIVLWIASLCLNAISLQCILYILIAIVPKFKTMFQSLGAELPAVTVIILSISDFITALGFVVIPLYIIAASILYFLSFKKRRWLQLCLLIHSIMITASIPVTFICIYMPIIALQGKLRNA